MASLLVLGAGYIGAALADRALAAGHEVILADNWHVTSRDELEDLERRGAAVETADIRDRRALDRLLAARPDRVVLLAAQASRPLSERDPDYTEQTNVTGVRRVAEAVAAAGRPPVAFASSLHVYGPAPIGEVDADHPYGAQGDLAHLSKIYGELCLAMHARRTGSGLDLLRLGIVYGPSPVEHDRPESQTVIDRFRRLAAAGSPLPLDDGGRATIGAVHVDDVARILLELSGGPGVRAANVAAESVTVAGVAALTGADVVPAPPACTWTTPFHYRHALADYARR